MRREEALQAEREFFDALLAGDAEGLDRILANEFILIDVITGSVVQKPAFASVIETGQLKFNEIRVEPGDLLVRVYGATAVITGRTQMRGSYEGAAFAARSRYTHVYVRSNDRIRLVTAQGTPASGD